MLSGTRPEALEQSSPVLALSLVRPIHPIPSHPVLSFYCCLSHFLWDQNGAFGVIENSRRCSFGYDQRVEVFGKGGSISGANRSPQDVLVNTEGGLNAGASPCSVHFIVLFFFLSFII